MEDVHVVSEDKKSGWLLFAVCDGHGGRGVVTHLQKNLAPTIFKSLARASLKHRQRAIPPIYLRHQLKKLVVRIDKNLHKTIKGRARGSGSTLILLVYQPRTRQIALVNVGDSRAALQLHPSNLIVETTDHKPTNETEIVRVLQAGSSIVRKRVGGVLAMTRALGDFALKKKRGTRHYDPISGAVSAVPDVLVGFLPVKVSAVAILACDGVWDVMTTKEAMKIVKSHPDDPSAALVDEAYNRGSTDNITALIVDIFPSCQNCIIKTKVKQ